MTRDAGQGRSRWTLIVAGSLAWPALGGCLREDGDDAERFRDAIPTAAQIEVAGPEAGEATSTAAAARGPLAPGAWDDGPWAKYYGLTREIRDGVNDVTAIVLGSAWVIVHTEPSSLGQREAIWGPWADSLSPAEYRFRVTERAPDEYDYALEGRKKGTAGAFVPVLSGRGHGRGDPRHGDGYFEIDLDRARELDPFEVREGSGRIRIEHDLDPRVTRELFVGDRWVSAEVSPSDSEVTWVAESVSSEDGTGTLYVRAHDDAQETRLTRLEDIELASAWRGDGAGRADVSVSGGDVPASVGTVHAVECWGADFATRYYSDTIEWEPTTGDLSACVFAEPIAPR